MESKSIQHKCPEWKGDTKIHPQLDWLWGTCLEFCSKGAKDKDGIYSNPFWMLLDETSETFSIWTEDHCPFCKVKLDTLIK